MELKDIIPVNPALVMDLTSNVSPEASNAMLTEILGISPKEFTDLRRRLTDAKIDVLGDAKGVKVIDTLELFSRVCKTPAELVFLAIGLGRQMDAIEKGDDLI